MRAIVIRKQVPVGESLSAHVALTSDWPEPAPPGPGQALVRTLASALNHLDLWVAQGVPGLNLTYPRISGSDACGVIEAVGPGVDASWIGKRVILNAAIDTAPACGRPTDPPASSLAPQYELIGEHHQGTLAERFVAPVANLAMVNDDHNPEHAAAFGLTFLTAYSMMITKAGLRPGQTVLITGIGGGVALAAMAIARHLGCPVAVTSRHAWKLDRARELGAELTILDHGQDWSKEVRNWSRARAGGVDLAVDSAGKATHLKCIKSLARGGAYVTPGCTSGPDAVTDLARIFWNQLRILGSTMGSNAEFQELAAMFRAGIFTPTIDQTFSAEQAPQAYERLRSAEQFGKVVVRW
jgi:NADPH:quinone reductase-like Zn-dependent oxidoreductase